MFPGLLLLVVAAEPPPAVPALGSLSFGNPFSHFEGGQIPGWGFGGDAFLADDYVALTPPKVDAMGWLWSEEPVRAREWVIELEFHIGGVPTRGAGGGLAFWFTSTKGTSRTGAIYGHEGTYNGLGIFFDTFDGEDEEKRGEPFVVAMMNYGEDLGKSSAYFDNQVRARSQPSPACRPHQAQRRRRHTRDCSRLPLINAPPAAPRPPLAPTAAPPLRSARRVLRQVSQPLAPGARADPHGRRRAVCCARLGQQRRVRERVHRDRSGQ
jgi:hypothetical protein